MMDQSCQKILAKQLGAKEDEEEITKLKEAGRKSKPMRQY